MTNFRHGVCRFGPLLRAATHNFHHINAGRYVPLLAAEQLIVESANYIPITNGSCVDRSASTLPQGCRKSD
jgi:hypothetical protein